MQVRHVTYNPNYGSLQNLCCTLEADGFMLSHIVPSTQYEWVAVFTKPDPEADE